jgi:2-oxo-4-hydroxy-4-carboxy-5-ureidoimidazoline decarboxylase
MGNRGLAMTTTRMTLTELNALDQDDFAAQRAFLFEGTPWVAAQAWHARPFSSLAHRHRILSSVMFNAPHERQVALIAAHPDLAGRTALDGELSPQSTREQAAAGLNRLLPDEMAAFTQLNDADRQTFGFPFVICVREIALGETARICWLRLLDGVDVEEHEQRSHGNGLSRG